MDSRVANAWRNIWPKAIPAHEYETALLIQDLIMTTGRRAGSPAAPTDDIGETVDAQEAARILGIAVPSVYVKIRSGKLRAQRVPGARTLMVSRVDVEHALAARPKQRRPGPRLALAVLRDAPLIRKNQ